MLACEILEPVLKNVSLPNSQTKEVTPVSPQSQMQIFLPHASSLKELFDMSLN